MEKAKALQLQVQTATFQKLESDLETDMAAVKDWADKEKVRKSSWQSMVLTHKLKRYVQGLAQVKKFSEDELSYRLADTTSTPQELAGFRHNLEQVIPTHVEKRRVVAQKSFQSIEQKSISIHCVYFRCSLIF